MHSFQADRAPKEDASITDLSWNQVLRMTSIISRRTLALAVLCTLLGAASPLSAATETVLYSFKKGAQGQLPNGGLVRDAKGNFYGTTSQGGLFKNSCGSAGCGTVFEVTPAGTEKVLYSFTGASGDGKIPGSGLMMDASGNLYGTTVSGGNGSGTVFEVALNGAEKVLYKFTGRSDGSLPDAGLMRDSKGNLYGTTLAGGLKSHGAVFELTPAGSETALFSFNGPDGASPRSILIQSAGNFYGTSSQGGGGSACASGCGVVFELSPNGTQTVIHVFTGGTDGAYPVGSLVRDAAGNLYGTATNGGRLNKACPTGCGTVYKLSPSPGGTWTFTVLHKFTGEGDGYYPAGGLVMDAKGNFYGLTGGNTCWGNTCAGSVFEITAAGTETILYKFKGKADGQFPAGSLVLDDKGNLYGTTYAGGANGYGTVFKVTP
jgi:uncharacterized repeat protein (TIGR03803 family)